MWLLNQISKLFEVLFKLKLFNILSRIKVNGNPLQYSCLENPVDGGPWWAVVYEVAQSRTQLKRFSIAL